MGRGAAAERCRAISSIPCRVFNRTIPLPAGTSSAPARRAWWLPTPGAQALQCRDDRGRGDKGGRIKTKREQQAFVDLVPIILEKHAEAHRASAAVQRYIKQGIAQAPIPGLAALN